MCVECEEWACYCHCVCCGARISGWMVAMQQQNVTFNEMFAKASENDLRRKLKAQP